MSCPLEFNAILHRFNMAREHALHLIGAEYAYPIKREGIWEMLQRMASSANPLTCLIENPGTLHIHTSSIERTTKNRRWLSILDPGFNFYLDETSVANAWVFRRPTCKGIVTSLEAYDQRGSLLAQFFGRRNDDGEEAHWRTLTASLPRVAI
jgi:putative hemin transport protein